VARVSLFPGPVLALFRHNLWVIATLARWFKRTKRHERSFSPQLVGQNSARGVFCRQGHGTPQLVGSSEPEIAGGSQNATTCG
jgi:hypothetical protein